MREGQGGILSTTNSVLLAGQYLGPGFRSQFLVCRSPSTCLFGFCKLLGVLGIGQGNLSWVTFLEQSEAHGALGTRGMLDGTGS